MVSVGYQSHNGIQVKHLQFGIESNAPITETAWNELNDNPCYYDGSNWRYLPGYVTHGSTSCITWIGDKLYRVGGETYTGVNKKSSWDDGVRWEYTGTTIADDSGMWSGGGIVSDSVATPYN